VAVALGGDPATIYAASAPLPEDVDEMMFSGFLRREPVELVRCVTNDIEVPAHAEVILEGYVDPDELRTEGRSATTPGTIRWRTSTRSST
jgi:4-hydroxy-3-polyprenylbenzoate decarboxylase